MSQLTGDFVNLMCGINVRSPLRAVGAIALPSFLFPRPSFRCLSQNLVVGLFQTDPLPKMLLTAIFAHRLLFVGAERGAHRIIGRATH